MSSSPETSYVQHTLDEKRKLLFHAVEENNVDLLRDLLDSPKWYTIKGNTLNSEGCNLLQYAIIRNKRKIFDYLLSLPDFPLELEDDEERTALEISLNPDWNVEAYYASELIKKGAVIDDKINKYGNTLLQEALNKRFSKVSKLLIEKGVDVNICNYVGCTPLYFMCRWGVYEIDDFAEVFTMLLMFGGDPLFTSYSHSKLTIFELCVLEFSPKLIDLLKILINYTCDENESIEIDFETLLRLAVDFPPLFYEIMKRTVKTKIKYCKNDGYVFTKLLSSLNSDILKIIIEKFETPFKHYLIEISCKIYNDDWFEIPFKNLKVLFESNLQEQVINFLNNFNSSNCLDTLISRDFDVSGYLCYLLSYGFEIVEFDFYVIYENFGYRELFKILLHMDFTKGRYKGFPLEYEGFKDNYGYFYQGSFITMPLFIVNITETIQNIEKYARELHPSQVKELTRYFSHPILNSMSKENIKRINLPQVPLLKELARNTFRSYLVERYEIKTTRQFYTILNFLPISSVYKKIISYETKLYNY